MDAPPRDAHAEPGSVPLTRPDVGTFPPATTAAFIALVLAEVAVGLFLGNWLFNEVRGAEWVRTLQACLEQSRSTPQATFACYSGIERMRGIWAIAGAIVVVAVGLVLMALAPIWIRRHRGLTDATRYVDAQARLDRESSSIGVRPPSLNVGPLRQRDAFSFGAFGTYAVAVPRALLSRANAELFDGVMRHELSHVRNRDIAFSWLANSIWFVVTPLLAAPIVWGLITLEPSLLPDYVPRAVVITVVVWIAARSLLRAREWEADLTAARAGATALALAERTVGMARSRQRTGIRRVFATHPSPESRLSVLREPERVTAIRFVEVATIGLLVAFSVPVLDQASQSTLAGGETLTAFFLSAAAAGAILGASVGLGVWRRVQAETAVCAVDAGHLPSRSRLVPAAGLATGIFVGELLSLSHTGIPISDWLTAADLVAPLLVGATTVLVASFASVWIRAGGARTALIAAWATSIVLFATAWWLARMIQSGIDLLGWPLFAENAALLIGSSGGWIVGGGVLTLALATAAALGIRSAEPREWWYAGGSRSNPPAAHRRRSLLALALVGGALVGLLCVAIVVVWWFVDASFRASGQDTLVRVILLPSVLAGFWSVGASLWLRDEGPAVGLVGGVMLVCVGTVGGALALSLASGQTDPRVLASAAFDVALVCALPLGATLIIFAAIPAAFTRSNSLQHLGWRSATVPALAAAVGVAVGALAFTLPAPPVEPSSPSAGAPGTLVSDVEYVYGHAPGFLQTYVGLRDQVAQAAQSFSSAPDETVALLSDQVLPQYSSFAETLDAMALENPDLATAHDSLRQAVAAMSDAVQMCLRSRDAASCVDPLAEPTPANLLENAWVVVVLEVADTLE